MTDNKEGSCMYALFNNKDDLIRGHKVIER